MGEESYSDPGTHNSFLFPNTQIPLNITDNITVSYHIKFSSIYVLNLFTGFSLVATIDKQLLLSCKDKKSIHFFSCLMLLLKLVGLKPK